MCLNVNYHVVTKENQHLHRRGFINVYQKAFGGAPYFEEHKYCDVKEGVFKPHLDHGIIVVASIDRKTIGLSCAIPFGMAPEEDQLFLKERIKDGSFSHSTENLWYMSELAVLEEHRKNGIGSELITKRLECILERGHNMYCMRTAASGSNSARIYLNMGSTQLPGLIDVSKTDQVQKNASQSNYRIMLYGNCLTAISKQKTNSDYRTIMLNGNCLTATLGQKDKK